MLILYILLFRHCREHSNLKVMSNVKKTLKTIVSSVISASQLFPLSLLFIAVKLMSEIVGVQSGFRNILLYMINL